MTAPVRSRIRIRRCTTMPLPDNFAPVMVSDLKKPFLATDVDFNNLDQLEYPRAVMFKYDGVRVLIKRVGVRAHCLGRSHKPHRNPHVQHLFGRDEYIGFDAEGIIGDPTAPDVVGVTSGGFSRFIDKPRAPLIVPAKLYVFGLHDHPGTFVERHAAAAKRIADLKARDPLLPIELIPYEIVRNAAELLAFEQRALDLGYEGVITMKLTGLYKNGRSTLKEQGYLRMKRFEEREMLVTRLEEGNTNGNEAKKNELGHTERSSHQANMTPNGMVGAIHGTDTKTKQPVKVAPGKMTDEQAKEFLAHPELIVGKISKYKFFPKGTVGKPRFPTWQCIRAPEDIS